MRRDPEPAEPRHILDDGVSRPAERIRRARHVERDVVSFVCADLHRIEAQHALDIFGRVRRPRAVAVVGQDDEFQTGACRRVRDRRLVAYAVRSRRVDVIRAGNSPRRQVAPPGRVERLRRRRDHQRPEQNGGCSEPHDCRPAIED